MCKKSKIVGCFLTCLLFFLVAISFPYETYINLINGAVITCEEFNNLKNNFFIDSVVLADNGDNTFDEYVVNFNLFQKL